MRPPTITHARAHIWGEQARRAAAEIAACLADTAGDASWPISAPDEPVVTQRDLDERAEMAYERWLDRDERRSA